MLPPNVLVNDKMRLHFGCLEELVEQTSSTVVDLGMERAMEAGSGAAEVDGAMQLLGRGRGSSSIWEIDSTARSFNFDSGCMNGS